MGHEANARQKLAAVLANNPNLKDRFGRPIMEGGGYTAHFLQPPVYTVEQITPALDRPDLPPGTFRVVLTSRITLLLANGIPTEELALCAMPKAMQAASTEPPPVDPPVDPPAPPGDAQPDDAQPSTIHLTDAPALPEAPALPKETPDVP